MTKEKFKDLIEAPSIYHFADKKTAENFDIDYMDVNDFTKK